MRPAPHKPLRHLMADNRGQNPYTTVPCPELPDGAYATADPIGNEITKPAWPIYGEEVTGIVTCGRLLVGQGTDTSDPLCTLPIGHKGLCKP